MLDVVLEILTVLGIVSFSAAGAMVAVDSEMDIFGVVFLSVITCFGGGLLRDTMAGPSIGQNAPMFFSYFDLSRPISLEPFSMSGLYIPVSIITALTVFFIAKIFKRQYVEDEKRVVAINNILDAIGIGLFSAAGTAMYLERGAFIAIVLGMVSSIGGSMTRDIILGRIPFFLRKHIYALTLLAGSALYYVIVVFFMPGAQSASVVATLSCLALIFTLRMCATAFKWNMPKAIDFKEMRGEEAVIEKKTEEKV